MISEYTVPWLTVENPQARTLALEWMKSKKEHIAAAGWCTYGGLLALKPDDELDLAEVESLLNTVVKQIHNAPNRVRHTMNIFVISVGGYVKPLLTQAKAAARQIGAVTVDMGETACKVPLTRWRTSRRWRPWAGSARSARRCAARQDSVPPW